MKESWANINRKGHRNSAHNHLTATFSGCYYIQSGYNDDELASGHGKATALEFLPPPANSNGSVANDGVARPELEPWSHEALGVAGTLALWPGPINHSVPVHHGPRDRVSLAFNLAITFH